MSETTDTGPWPDRQMTEAQRGNRDAAALIQVTRSGAVPTDFAQMVDYAKFMSTAVGFVGGHLLKNVGACLGIMEVANQFGLPTFAVARQSYLVNGRIAFMGQFFHTIVEDYAPLEKGPNGRKLQFRYEGDGPTLKIIVSGTFKGATEPVEYESPMFKDLKVKNSPLWATEPRRQFIFFGVRGWQTVNWPEGILHAISEDEAASLPPSDYARDVTPLTASTEAEGLRERLARTAAAHGDKPREGFTEGFTEAHFEEVVADGHADAEIDHALAAAVEQPATSSGEAPATPADDGFPGDKPAAKPPASRRRARPEAAAKPAAATPEPEPAPKSAAGWISYASAWLMAETDPAAMRTRWTREQKMRNALGVTSEERDPVFEVYQQRLGELEGE